MYINKFKGLNLQSNSFDNQETGIESLKSQIEVVQPSKSTYNIQHLFVVEGDKRFDLGEYLPKGVLFREGQEWAFSPEKKKESLFSVEDPPNVRVPLHEINTQSGRLALLHEMGHAIEEIKLDRAQPAKLRKLITDISNILITIRRSSEYLDIESQDDRDDYLKKKFHGMRKSTAFSELGDDETFLNAIQQLARDERNAWANALLLYRKIKRDKGVSFLGEMNKDEVFALIEDKLATYQKTYSTLAGEQGAKLFFSKQPADII